MDFSLFFTAQTPQTGTPGAKHTALSGSGPIPGQNFIDFILARLTEGTEEGKKDKDSGVLTSDNPTLDKEPKLDIVKLLAASPEIEEQVQNDSEDFSLDVLTQIAEALELNQQLFDEQLNPVTPAVATKIDPEQLPQIKNILENLLIGTEETAETKPALRKIENIVNILDRLIAEESPALIVTNLTPEQIATLKENLEAINNPAHKDAVEISQDSNDIAALVLAGLVNILPPQAKPEVIILPRGVVISEKPLNINTDNAANDTAAKLNNIVVGGSDLVTAPETEQPDFESLVKNMAGKNPDKGSDGHILQQPKAPPTTTPNASVMQNIPVTDQTFIYGVQTWDEVSADEMSLLQGATTHINGPSALASLVTQTQSATHAHPATQAVAIMMQKHASSGESKSLTLQLDPPELGRVEVRMEFGKDKTLKTHMLIEKPETYLLLQRDAHMLERTLQASGLDSESGINFELAAQDYDFGQDSSRNGGGNGSDGAGDIADGDIEIIESTMNWYIDPESGHTRYNLVT